MPTPQDRSATNAAAGAPPVARGTPGDRASPSEPGGAPDVQIRRLLQRLCERARAELGANYAAVGVSPATGTLRWAATAGVDVDAWERRVFPLARAVATQAQRTRRPTSVLPPITADGVRSAAAERVQGALVLPMLHGAAASPGVLVLGWRTVWPASAKHVALAQQFADQAWLLLETLRLFEEAAVVQRSAEAARRRAEDSDHAKGMFLATMSHEIRTPLNAVLGYAELLELEIDGPLNDAQRDRLGRLRRTGHHLLSLVTGILDVAKVEAGEMSVRREIGDLRDVLTVAIAAVVPQATAGGLVLNDDCPERTPVRYIGDEDRVRQIIVNLLSNAVKFTPPGGWVTLSAQRVPHAVLGEHVGGSGPWLRVDVADTGVGIPASRQNLIFDPFVQGHAAHERAAAGTGLGLTISRRLARLMGGEITLVSAPGAGSRFSLWLPTD